MASHAPLRDPYGPSGSFCGAASFGVGEKPMGSGKPSTCARGVGVCGGSDRARRRAAPPPSPESLARGGARSAHRLGESDDEVLGRDVG